MRRTRARAYRESDGHGRPWTAACAKGLKSRKPLSTKKNGTPSQNRVVAASRKPCSLPSFAVW